MRIYDPRIGRFLSVDPLSRSYPFYTPYQFAANMPIWAIDLDGGEAEIMTVSNTKIAMTEVRVVAGTKIFKTANDNIQFTGKAAILADGSPKAYGPNNTGTDFTSSAGYPKGTKYIDENGKEQVRETANWWGVVTDKWENDNESEQVTGTPIMGVDGTHWVSTTTYNYEGPARNVQEKYVNTDKVPVAVLPKKTAKALKVELGSLVYTYNTETKVGSWAIFLEKRDRENTIGELGGKAAKNIKIKKLSPRGGGQSSGITYTFYRDTAPTGQFRNDDEVNDYIKRNSTKLEQGKPLSAEDRSPRSKSDKP